MCQYKIEKSQFTQILRLTNMISTSEKEEMLKELYLQLRDLKVHLDLKKVFLQVV